MTQKEAIQSEIDGAADYLLDAAPVERAHLDEIFTEVLRATGMELYQRVEQAAIAYANATADRAYALGLELGRQQGYIRCEAAPSPRGAGDAATAAPGNCTAAEIRRA